jgi:hypothetical protein
MSKAIKFIGIGVAAIIALVVVVWAIFFRKIMGLGELFKKIFEIVLIPFKLILQIFGVGVKSPAAAAAAPPPQIDIVQHQIGTCPPCDVKCPEIPKAQDCKPLELEISYLKKMVKFIGTMAKRENAINSQYREIYPGFSVMSPAVRRLSYEYNYMKNQIRDDENEWTYFKNYFTKLSGIPSTSSAVHYDLTM